MKNARRISRIIPVAALWIISACTDPSGTTTESGRFGTNQSALSASEFELLPVAEVKLDVEGELKPNSAIRLRATTTGVASARAVELRISAPEIEAARTSGWSSSF